MSTAKDEMSKVIEEQPEDSTYEEILRELAFRRMVDRGLADARSGKTVTNQEMARRISSWRR